MDSEASASVVKRNPFVAKGVPPKELGAVFLSAAPPAKKIADLDPDAYAPDEYDVSVLPGWKPRSNDAAHDFAVLRSVDVFAGVSPSDYATIDVGTVSSSGRMDFYGYGSTGNNGTCYTPGAPGTPPTVIPGTPSIGDSPGTPNVMIAGTPAIPGTPYPCP